MINVGDFTGENPPKIYGQKIMHNLTDSKPLL